MRNLVLIGLLASSFVGSSYAGDTASFWAYDYGFFQRYYKVNALKRAEGDYCHIYTAEDYLSLADINVNPATGALYAVAWNFLFISTDDGESWDTTGPQEEEDVWTEINCLAAHAKSSTKGVVMLGTPSYGIYWTENDGTSWKEKNSSLGNKLIRAVAIAPLEQNSKYNMYAATEGGIFSRGQKITAKWAQISDSGLVGNITSLAAHPTDKDIVYAGTDTGGVYKWVAADSEWIALNNGLTDLHINKVVCAPDDGGVLYAATPSGVFKTVDGGNNWEAKNTGLTNTDVNTILNNEFDTEILYAGTEGGGVFKSSNGAETWEAKNTGFEDWGVPPYIYNCLSFVATSLNTIYVGNEHGVFKSDDGGGLWTESNTGLLLSFVKDAQVEEVLQGFEVEEFGKAVGIYNTVRDFFGDEPDVDGDPKIYLLIMDITEDPNTDLVIPSYFDPWNEYEESEIDTSEYRSNYKEILYIDAALSGTELIGGIAGAFHDMIHWKLDPNEDEWVTAGCRMFAKYLVDAAPAGKVPFPKRNNLLFWGDASNEVEEGYSYLLTMYLYERFGGDTLVKLIAKNTKTGIEGITDALNSLGYPDTFNVIFEDFCVACYFDIPDTTFYDGKYGIENADINLSLSMLYWTAGVKPHFLAPLEPFSADYLQNSDDFTLGMDTAIVFRGDYTVGGFRCYINREEREWQAPVNTNAVITKLALDSRNRGVALGIPAFLDTLSAPHLISIVVINADTIGTSPASYVIADDVVSPFFTKVGVFQNALAPEFLTIYVFSNEYLYENASRADESPLVEVITGTNSNFVSMSSFSEPDNDTIKVIYSGTYKLAGSGNTKIILTGQDAAGNPIIPDTNEISVKYMSRVAGGTIGSPDSKLLLEIPVNTLPTDGYITVAKERVLLVPVPEDREAISEAYIAGPSGLTTHGAMRLSMQYEGDYQEEDVGIYRLEEEHWIYVGGTSDVEERLTCEITKLGVYQVQKGPHEAGSTPVIKEFRLNKITPSPFSTATSIQYQLPKKAHVSIKVYNLTGQLVKTLIDGEEGAGVKTVVWNGETEGNRKVATGIYFVRMKTSGYKYSKKVIKVKGR